LYAKALALLGLGVLAGTGALVDYWPIGISYPAVSSALDLPEAARPAALPEHTATVVAAQVTPAARRHVASAPSADITFAPLSISASASLAGQPVMLRDPSEVAFAPSAVVQEPSAQPDTSIVQVDEVVEAEAPSEYLPLEARMPAVARADTGGGPGFISGAFRKTGSSIVKTGAKTGASIFDAVRVVGGAVRRALPN
jgi:hypothetical protein